MSEVHKFFYRGPRLSVRLPVSLRTPEFLFSGYTKDLSEHGLLVRLDGLVPAKTCGRLTVDFGAAGLELDVVVAYNEILDVGLDIRFESDMQREVFRKFVSALLRKVS